MNLARWVGDQLMAHGTVQRAILGVRVQSIDNALSNQLGLTTVKGAVVTDVLEGSPAAKAGLQSGDVVLEFDGTAISKPADLQARVERASLNDTHQLMIIRDGNTMTLNVKVKTMPTTVSAMEPAKTEPPTQSEFNGPGLQLSELTNDVARQLGMEGVGGVVITAVKSGSSADQAGLKPGMVIKKVGHTTVNSIGDVEAALKNAPLNDGVLMLVKFGDASRFVVLKS